MKDFQGRGIADGYARGRAHIRALNRQARSLQTATDKTNLSASLAGAARTLPTDIKQGANPLGSDGSAPARTPAVTGTATIGIARSGEIRSAHPLAAGETPTQQQRTTTHITPVRRGGIKTHADEHPAALNLQRDAGPK